MLQLKRISYTHTDTHNFKCNTNKKEKHAFAKTKKNKCIHKKTKQIEDKVNQIVRDDSIPLKERQKDVCQNWDDIINDPLFQDTLYFCRNNENDSENLLNKLHAYFSQLVFCRNDYSAELKSLNKTLLNVWCFYFHFVCLLFCVENDNMCSEQFACFACFCGELGRLCYFFDNCDCAKLKKKKMTNKHKKMNNKEH